MAISSSTQPSLRARIIPRFPAQVLAGNGMSITKSGGVYTFSVVGAIGSLDDLPDIPTDRLLGRDTAGTGPPEALTVSGGLGFTGAGGLELTANQRVRTIPIWLDNAGAALTTGVKADVQIPFSCIITDVALLADQVGSVVIDIWKDTYANYPPTVADSICAAQKPTISSAIKALNNTLTGWNVDITAGDTLRFNVDSVATITRLCINVNLRTV